MTFTAFDFIITDLSQLERAERKYSSFVYVIQSGDGPVKIGSASSAIGRLKSMQVGNHTELTIPAVVMCGARAVIENEAHILLRQHRIRGEWFDVSPLEAIEGIVRAAEAKGRKYAPIWADIDDWFIERNFMVD